MLETLTLMLIGALTGIMAGLFGIGGGLIVVPALAFWLPLKGIAPEQALHVAIATSLASITVTASASAWAHFRRGAVDVRALGWLVPGLLLGSGGGALIVALVPRTPLTVFVAAFCWFAAWQIWRPRRAEAEGQGQASPLTLVPAGLGIGLLSAGVGIGGGSLTVPLLYRLGSGMRQAIATSAAAGLPIALAGTLSYMRAETPPALSTWAVGLVDFKLALAIGSLSVLTAPIGAALAHRWPVQRLKRGFAGWLVLVSMLLVAKLW
ncbi:MAG: sulfite exporter TauE/SafE family protein [Lysobacterales bacterium]